MRKFSDPDAIVASKILSSLEKSNVPSLRDLSDLRNLHDLGFKSYMLSDGVCIVEDAFYQATSILKKHFLRK